MLLSSSSRNDQGCSCCVIGVYGMSWSSCVYCLLPHQKYDFCCYFFLLLLFLFYLCIFVSLFCLKKKGDEPEHSNPNSVEFFVAKMAYQTYCEYQKQLLSDVNGARTYNMWKRVCVYVVFVFLVNSNVRCELSSIIRNDGTVLGGGRGVRVDAVCRYFLF